MDTSAKKHSKRKESAPRRRSFQVSGKVLKRSKKVEPNAAAQPLSDDNEQPNAEAAKTMTPKRMIETTKKPPNRRPVQLISSSDVSQQDDESTILSPNGTIRNRHLPVTEEQKRHYAAFIKDAFQLGVVGMLKQFDEMRSFLPQNMSRTQFDRHPEKNRYKDVFCLDRTRVVLQEKINGSDYIHASWVSRAPLINRFICTQGPLERTTADFWRMIVQERVELIIMLCETVENGRPKCHQYWPRESGSIMEFDGIKVRNRGMQTDNATQITITTLDVKSGQKKSLKVKHLIYKTWPDRSIPTSVEAPFQMLKLARLSKRPTVVHCSRQPLDMQMILQNLRSQRIHCIQTAQQLVFVYKCVLEYGNRADVIREPELKAQMAKFSAQFDQLLAEATGAVPKPVQAPNQPPVNVHMNQPVVSLPAQQHNQLPAHQPVFQPHVQVQAHNQVQHSTPAQIHQPMIQPHTHVQQPVAQQVHQPAQTQAHPPAPTAIPHPPATVGPPPVALKLPPRRPIDSKEKLVEASPPVATQKIAPVIAAHPNPQPSTPLVQSTNPTTTPAAPMTPARFVSPVLPVTSMSILSPQPFAPKAQEAIKPSETMKPIEVAQNKPIDLTRAAEVNSTPDAANQPPPIQSVYFR
ncbi:hypothetical protein M3Y98_00757200 [Aphelenchoides besseyi]|nr:hypothetical protein M3Y98_00757200 [Aphelenchoides besseyi]